MKTCKKLLALLLSIAMIVGVTFVVPATSVAAATNLKGVVGVNKKVSYEFTGEEAARAGYAEGTIYLSGASADQYYAVYWADDNGVLANYEYLAYAEGIKDSITIPANIAIPEGATKLVAFTCKSVTEESFGVSGVSDFRYYYPDVANKALSAAYDIVNIPASKQYHEKAEFKFASFSDMHLNYSYAAAKATKAFNWANTEGAKYAAISGDFSNNGTASELSSFRAAAYQSTFKYENIFECSGNHESSNIGNWQSYLGGDGFGEIYTAIGDYEDDYITDYSYDSYDFEILGNDSIKVTNDSGSHMVEANVEYHDEAYDDALNTVIVKSSTTDAALESVTVLDPSTKKALKGEDGLDKTATISPWYYAVVEGEAGEKDNVFISISELPGGISNTPGADIFTEQEMDWLERTLEKFSGSNSNIFLMQHAPIYDFASGDPLNGYSQPMMLRSSYAQTCRFKNLLTEYKEVIWTHGHTHMSFYNNIKYPNQVFSDMNGTFCRSIHNSSTAQPRFYDLDFTVADEEDDDETTTSTSDMDELDDTSSVVYVTNAKNSEGAIFTTYKDDIVFNSANLNTKLYIPLACVIMPSYSESRNNVESIEIDTSSMKTTNFKAGSYFEPEGLKVKAHYKDGTSKYVNGWGFNMIYTSTSTSAVEITFGGCTADLTITVDDLGFTFVNNKPGLGGEGSKQNPYLITSADDFARFTAFIKTGISTKDMYFKQTADVDMAKYNEENPQKCYNAFAVCGTSSYSFDGIYDGNGKNINVNVIQKNCVISVFPILNGVVINTTVEGTLYGTSVMPVSAVTKKGMLVNFISRLTLKGTNAYGLTQIAYGTTYNCVYNGTISYMSEYGGSGSLYALTSAISSNSIFDNAYFNYKSASSKVVKKPGEVLSVVRLTIDNMNSTTHENYSDVIAKLAAYSYNASDVMKWNVNSKGIIIIGEDPTVTPDTEQKYGDGNFSGGYGTFEQPYLISNQADFFALTKCFGQSNVRTAAETYGYGKYYKQTADIDMTGYVSESGEVYTGCHACSANSEGFGGFYDGCGYKLKAEVWARDTLEEYNATTRLPVGSYPYSWYRDPGRWGGEVDLTNNFSFFPYSYGVIMNCSFEGTVNEHYVQPIRTVYGTAVNCSNSMNVAGSSVSGAVYTLYGSLINFYNSFTPYYFSSCFMTAKSYYGIAKNCYFNVEAEHMQFTAEDFSTTGSKYFSEVETYVSVYLNDAEYVPDMNEVATKMSDKSGLSTTIKMLQKGYSSTYSAASFNNWKTRNYLTECESVDDLNLHTGPNTTGLYTYQSTDGIIYFCRSASSFKSTYMSTTAITDKCAYTSYDALLKAMQDGKLYNTNVYPVIDRETGIKKNYYYYNDADNGNVKLIDFDTIKVYANTAAITAAKNSGELTPDMAYRKLDNANKVYVYSNVTNDWESTYTINKSSNSSYCYVYNTYDELRQASSINANYVYYCIDTNSLYTSLTSSGSSTILSMCLDNYSNELNDRHTDGKLYFTTEKYLSKEDGIIYSYDSYNNNWRPATDDELAEPEAIEMVKNSTVIGDVNNDGKVNAKDSILLSRFVAEWTKVTVNEYNSDIYNDNNYITITAADVMILNRYLANWSDTKNDKYYDRIATVA